MKTKSSVPFKVGDAVVYTAVDGSSVSATIAYVYTDCVYVQWYPAYAQKHTACVPKADWSTRLVAFGNALFLAI